MKMVKKRMYLYFKEKKDEAENSKLNLSRVR